MARSAPFQYGPEVSASQKRWVSKLASTRGRTLLHVRRRQLVLRGELRHRAVLLQRRDRTPERGPERGVRLAVVDPERVLLGEQVGDLQLAGVLADLVRGRGVLREDGVGAA